MQLRKSAVAGNSDSGGGDAGAGDSDSDSEGGEGDQFSSFFAAAKHKQAEGGGADDSD